MRIKDTKHFDREGFSGDIYISDEDKKGFNTLRVTVNGKHEREEIEGFTRVYFVISGEGTFTVNSVKEEVQKDDLYVINPGDSYEYEGVMELFEFNVYR